MTYLDLQWFDKCCGTGLLKSPFLEIGSAKVQGINNLCDLARGRGIKSLGVDLQKMDGVDHVADFSVPGDEFRRNWVLGNFATVAIFNVLEHTFDPIHILDNALGCLEPEGTLLVLTPAIWPIHNYPADFLRLLPDWYRRFAAAHELRIIEDCFCWVSSFAIEPVANHPEFPTYISRKAKASPSRYWVSRFVHKALNTYGRNHWATHCAIGAAFERP